jgi:ABC-type glycerol-3-phosphate transport system substrate-binding protein
MKGFIRKMVISIFLCFIVATFAWAGGAKGTSAGSTSGKKITIRLLTRISGADSNLLVLEMVKKDFQAKYPDIIIQDESKNDIYMFEQQLQTDIATGNTADIIQWPGIGIMKEYAQSGVFLNIADLINNTPDVKNNVDSTLLSMLDLTAVGVPGIYALPFSTNMELFFYNTELFAKAGIQTVPKTWDEFYEACDKLLKIGVIPWGMGANYPWRAVHAFTGIMYKMLGVQKAVDLGARRAKWTDPDIVACLAHIKNLADKGYLGKDFVAIDYETEKARFMNGETAMIFDGIWCIGEIPPGALARTGTFRMPYFTNRPQFREQDIAYPAQIELGGHLKNDPEKLKYVWELATMFVDRIHQEAFLYQATSIPVRQGITVDTSRLNPLMVQVLNFRNTEIKVWGSDCWAYDPLPNMETVLYDALAGLLNGMSAADTGKQIQSKLEQAER